MFFSLKDDAACFRSDIAIRGISRLVHFTTLINLFSIFEQGALLSRNRLDYLQITTPDLHLDHYLTINDRLRLDYAPNYVNLSIQLPNKWLLKAFKSAPERQDDVWCILAIDIEPIVWHDTLFSVNNAASTAARLAGIGPTLNHWKALFALSVKGSGARVFSRATMPDNLPTDAQAEVLVKDELPISLIQEVIFENDVDLCTARGSLPLVTKSPLPTLRTDSTLFI
jgi:hypothetical protein